MLERVIAEDLEIGDLILHEGKYVEEISYTARSVVARCSYSRGGYPATSILLDYDEELTVDTTHRVER